MPGNKGLCKNSTSLQPQIGIPKILGYGTTLPKAGPSLVNYCFILSGNIYQCQVVSGIPTWVGVGSLPTFNTLTAGSTLALTDLVPEYNQNTSANRQFNLGQIGGYVRPDTMMGRLSYSSTLPVTTSDSTSQSTLYLTPLYTGDRYCTYTSSSLWQEYSLSSALSLPLTQTFNVTTNGTTTVTLVSGTTAQLVRGMSVSIPGATFVGNISTIPSSTTFTVGTTIISHASTAGTVTLIGLTAYDVYLIDNSGSPALQFGNAWSTSTGASAARSDTIARVDGVYLNTVAINSSDNNGIAANAGRYLGTVLTNGAGTGEDSAQNRWLWNLYNQTQRHVFYSDASNSIHNNSTTTYAQVGSVQISYVVGFSTQSLIWYATCASYNSNQVGVYVIVAIGGSTTAKLTGSVTTFNIYATGGQGAGIPMATEYAPIGGQTRYLIFKSGTGTDTVGIDSTDADQPTTAMWGSILA
jgi:hypothetical protein